MTNTSPDDTVRRISRAWRELRRGAAGATLRAHLLGPGGPELEQAQLDAIEILASRSDGWQMSDFADALRVDPSTATRAVSRLEQLGLAVRTTATHDRRIVVASVTATGRRVVERVHSNRAIGMERLLAPFDVAERDQLAAYLERFVGAIDDLVTDLGTAP